MPVVLTFDLRGATPLQRNRIQSFFERFGWQNLGGSSYRYPRLGSPEPVEDWFNQVVPALMLFRAFVRSSGCPLTKYTLDIQSSSGFDPGTEFGRSPASAADIQLTAPTNMAFGEQQLRTWIDGVVYPY